ncbi:putative dead box ATP-dependent RNA helicase [Corchorus olitorius]|uniref:Dead box ATP-dependent RNA helicase n=1 Tax=Corchorus olitorius TaxID=93759 RepID=A0A1R3J9F6_9ROSI|nr:putative dead box ATP-dependent RNA helicase [Corchorus olitorius]
MAFDLVTILKYRGSYPPGIGVGRGEGVNANPRFPYRSPQQHYVPVA